MLSECVPSYCCSTSLPRGLQRSHIYLHRVLTSGLCPPILTLTGIPGSSGEQVQLRGLRGCSSVGVLFQQGRTGTMPLWHTHQRPAQRRNRASCTLAVTWSRGVARGYARGYLQEATAGGDLRVAVSVASYNPLLNTPV